MKSLVDFLKRKKQQYKVIKTDQKNFNFTGEPSGEVAILKGYLETALRFDTGAKNAYLSKIKYEKDSNIRVALCVDTLSQPKDVIQTLSKHCSEIVSSIDIIYFYDLSDYHIKQLLSLVKPFYSKE